MNAPVRKTRKNHYAHKAKLVNFIAIARECGIDVAGFEVSPDGTIRVMEARAVPQQLSDYDRLEGEL